MNLMPVCNTKISKLKNKLIKEYKTGKTVKDLASKYNFVHTTLCRYFQKWNVDVSINKYKYRKYPNSLISNIKIQNQVKKLLLEDKLTLLEVSIKLNLNFNYLKNISSQKWKIKIPQSKIGNKNPNWRGHGEIHGAFWCKVAKNAKIRNIQFDLTIKEGWELFLKQNRKCALTGLLLSFGPRAHSRNIASLDRIYSSKKSYRNNCQWVHKIVNKMKMELDDKEFIDWCKLVAKYKK